jgi:hypothetical protein
MGCCIAHCWSGCQEPTHYAASLCKLQLKWACGCGCMSEAAHLAITIVCVSVNNEARKRKRKQRIWMVWLKKWLEFSHESCSMRTGNIFAAGLQTIFTNISFHVWWIIGDDYTYYSKSKHVDDRLNMHQAKIVPCCNQGYKIHIVDLLKKTQVRLQHDHEILELCLWELTSKFKRFLIQNIVFYHNKYSRIIWILFAYNDNFNRFNVPHNLFQNLWVQYSLKIQPYKVHPYTGTEALYRPFGPLGE